MIIRIMKLIFLGVIIVCITGCSTRKSIQLSQVDDTGTKYIGMRAYENSINTILIFNKTKLDKDLIGAKLYSKKKNIKLNFLIQLLAEGSETVKIVFETDDDNIKLKDGNEYEITNIKGKESTLLKVVIEKPFVNGSGEIKVRMDSYDEKGNLKFFGEKKYYYLITDEDISFSNNSLGELERLHLLNLYKSGKLSDYEYKQQTEELSRKGVIIKKSVSPLE